MNNFVIVDIETANPDITSICQIAIATYKNGTLIDEWETLVNPKQHFYFMNTAIHNIDANMVKNSPTLEQIEPIIKEKLVDNIICSYGPFDRCSLQKIFPDLKNDWLDIIKVVRRSWNNEFSQKGYGLANVAKKLKIKQQNHHNALDDVRTAGDILLKAINDSGENIDFWLNRIKKPINVNLEGNNTLFNGKVNINGSLYGEQIVFTGSLSIPRSEASKIALEAGCDVLNGVSKKTTILVIGEQNLEQLNGKNMSNKEIKAKQLIEAGHKISLLSENDFFNLINKNK